MNNIIYRFEKMTFWRSDVYPYLENAIRRSSGSEAMAHLGSSNVDVIYPDDNLYSPPSSGMGSASSVHASLQPSHAGSHMDLPVTIEESEKFENHVYEDLDLHGPPKITPISGVLGKGKVVIRPIAFKPVVSTNRYVTPHSVRSFGSNQSYHHDDIKSVHNHYNSSQNSFMLGSERSMSYSSDSCLKLSETPASYISSNMSRHSANPIDDYVQTPSPSDSGVAELEAILREKDSEINFLRETMEQNEQVIFKVYEEKEVAWTREMKRLKEEFESKFKSQQQKAFKVEQILMMQTFQLQQEKKKLKQELEHLKNDHHCLEKRYEDCQHEMELVKHQLEETNWSMCQKTGEISLLKSQLKDSQGDSTSKMNEMLALKAQLKETKCALSDKEREIKELQNTVANLHKELTDVKSHFETARQEIQKRDHDTNTNREQKDAEIENLKEEAKTLRTELNKANLELTSQMEQFEEERTTWHEEKEKVIRYQKQLQLNYVQMYRRNRTLEAEVEQLTLELECRDIKLISSDSQC